MAKDNIITATKDVSSQAINVCVIEEDYNSKNYRGSTKNIEYYIIQYTNFRDIKQNVSSINPDVILIDENSDPYDLAEYFTEDYLVLMMTKKSTLEKWREAIANNLHGIIEQPVDYGKIMDALKTEVTETSGFAGLQNDGHNTNTMPAFIDDTSEPDPVTTPRPGINNNIEYGDNNNDNEPGSISRQSPAVPRSKVKQLTKGQSSQGQLRKTFGSGKIIAYFNTKGGTGKTTFSLNTAAYLAYLYPSKKVAIVDFDIDLGDVANFLDLENNINLLSWQHIPENADPDTLYNYIMNYTIRHNKTGLHVLPAPAPPIDESEFTYKVAHRILATAKQFFDYVIIDTGPNLRDANIITMENSHRVYLITTDDLTSLRNVYDLSNIFEKLRLKQDKFSLILNAETKGTESAEIKQFIPYDILLRVPNLKSVKQATAGYEFSYLQKRFNPYMQDLIADITGKEPPQKGILDKIKNLI